MYRLNSFSRVLITIIGLLIPQISLSEEIKYNEIDESISDQEVFDNLRKSIAPRKAKSRRGKHIDIQYAEPTKVSEESQVEARKRSYLDIEVQEKPKKAEVNHNDLVVKAYKAALSGQSEAAIYLYKKALGMEPKNTNTLYALGSLYHKLKQYSEAKEIYKRLLGIYPKHKKALNNYLVLIAEESPDAAIMELKDLERVNPNFSPVLAQLGMIYARKNDLIKAERYLRKAVLSSPDIVAYRYNLAVVYDRLGHFKEALRFYEQVIDARKRGIVLPQSYEEINDRIKYLQTK